MKKIFILFLIYSNMALGQSVTISPADASHTKISKFGGTAKLEIAGLGAIGLPGTTGNSEISLSNMTYLGQSSTSSIKFNGIYSIKNTYTPNLGGSIENSFGIFYNTTPFLTLNPNSTTLETLPIGIRHSVPNLLTLSNTNTLAVDVKSEMYFETGNYYTGAIKTIGNDSTTSRLSFFTGSNSNYASLQERFSILNNGKVGIGTNTVSTNELLEVNGRMRLRRNAFASGFWLNNSANGTTLTDGAFVGLNNESPGTESAGFWLNGAFRWFVDRAGNTTQNTVTATNLVGTGVRKVYTDANGTLVQSPNVAFAAYGIGVSNFLVTNTLWTNVPFLNEEYDLNNNYNNTTGEFTAPFSGIYHFDAYVMWVQPTVNTGDYDMSINVDGGYFMNVTAPILANKATSLQLGTDLKLNSGQVVNIQVYQDSGVNQNIFYVPKFTRFTGHLVSRL